MVCRMAAIGVSVANNFSSQLGSCRHIYNRLKRGQSTVTWTCCGRLGLEQTDNSMMGIAEGAVIDGHQNGHRFGTYGPYRRRRHFLPRYASVLRPSSSDLPDPARDVDVRHFQGGSAVAKSNSMPGPMVVERTLHGSNAHLQ